MGPLSRLELIREHIRSAEAGREEAPKFSELKAGAQIQEAFQNQVDANSRIQEELRQAYVNRAEGVSKIRAGSRLPGNVPIPFNGGMFKIKDRSK